MRGQVLPAAPRHQHEQAVLGQQGDEPPEDVVDVVQAGVVGVVVELHVGHDRDLGAQEQQAAVALVGLGDEPLARAHAGVGADVVELAADEEGRVEAGLAQHVGDHRRGGRLAVGAGHGDAAAQLHDAGEHLGAPQHRQAGGARRAQLRVALGDGRGRHDQGGVAEVGGVVADGDRDAGLDEVTRVARRLEVRAAHVDAELVEHRGDAAHARAADADEVDRLREVPRLVAHQPLALVSSGCPRPGRPRAARRPACPARRWPPPWPRGAARSPSSSATSRASSAPPSSASSTRSAAPPATIYRAFLRWWSAVAYGYGTRIAGLPSAASSATEPPERATTRSAAAMAAARRSV